MQRGLSHKWMEPLSQYDAAIYYLLERKHGHRRCPDSPTPASQQSQLATTIATENQYIHSRL